MLIVEEVLLQWGYVEERMRDGWERKARSSSFFYQNMASRARKKKSTNPLVLPAAAWRPCSGDIAIAYIEGIVVYSSAALDYILAAVPSGAAQEARYPAGTLGDIHAVTCPGPNLTSQVHHRCTGKLECCSPLYKMQQESAKIQPE